MKSIIDLNNFFWIEWYKTRKEEVPAERIWNKELLELKFNRFYIVETSSHNEENFSVKLELRYGLRSKEANVYGDRNQTFYDRYLSTISLSIEDIENPELYKQEIISSLNKLNKKEEKV